MTAERLELEARFVAAPRSRRLGRLRRRGAAALVVAGVLLAVAVASYAYFTTSGTGTGSAFVAGGTFGPPVIDPAGSPAFSLTNMAPGDTETQSVTVQAVGGGPYASRLSIYESGATGALLPALELKIVEDGSTVVYDGQFAGGWTAAAPLVLPGNASGGLWNAGEIHSFVFTVTFPTGVGNAYQGKSASASFVWLRSQGS